MDFSSAPAAMLIFIATIGVSLYAMFKDRMFYEKHLLSPYRVVNDREFGRIITHGFLHADPMHLIFNMLTFFFFAFSLERTIGTFSFVIVYFGCLAIASITTIKKHKDNPNYRAVGASGAISGVLFSMILFYPTNNIYIFFALPIPAFLFAILYLVYCWQAGKNSRDFINHEAHLWGALGGLILTILLEPWVLEHFFYELGF